MSDASERADEALRQFQARVGEAAAGAETALDPAQIVAEELGVEPEEISLPAGVRRGFMLFELEDGSFGSQPLDVLPVQMTVEDCVVLAHRFVRRAEMDMMAKHVVRLLGQATKPARAGVRLPVVGGVRRSQ